MRADLTARTRAQGGMFTIQLDDIPWPIERLEAAEATLNEVSENWELMKEPAGRASMAPHLANDRILRERRR